MPKYLIGAYSPNAAYRSPAKVRYVGQLSNRIYSLMLHANILAVQYFNISYLPAIPRNISRTIKLWFRAVCCDRAIDVMHWMTDERSRSSSSSWRRRMKRDTETHRVGRRRRDTGGHASETDTITEIVNELLLAGLQLWQGERESYVDRSPWSLSFGTWKLAAIDSVHSIQAIALQAIGLPHAIVNPSQVSAKHSTHIICRRTDFRREGGQEIWEGIMGRIYIYILYRVSVVAGRRQEPLILACRKIFFQKYKIWDWNSPILWKFIGGNWNPSIYISSVGNWQLSLGILQLPAQMFTTHDAAGCTQDFAKRVQSSNFRRHLPASGYKLYRLPNAFPIFWDKTIKKRFGIKQPRIVIRRRTASTKIDMG